MGETNLEKLRMSHFNLDVKLTDELPYVELWTRTSYIAISGLYPGGCQGCKVTRHRNTVLLILHLEVWTDHVQASADAEEIEDLKKQESLTVWRCESLGKNMETHMPRFPKHLSSVTFSSSKGHIHSNRPHAWHQIDTL